MALQQGIVTITGRVGSAPQPFGPHQPPTICSFRLASTRGYYDSAHQWRSLPTIWITVKAFRSLATNALMSLHVGDPVVVSGMLGAEEWTGEDGAKRSRNVLEASAIGHDLNYGTTFLTRTHKDASSSHVGTSKAGREPDGGQHARDGVIPSNDGSGNTGFPSIDGPQRPPAASAVADGDVGGAVGNDGSGVVETGLTGSRAVAPDRTAAGGGGTADRDGVEEFGAVEM